MVNDERIEPIVRSIFGAVVKHDEDKLDASLSSFPDDASRLQGVQLAIAVTPPLPKPELSPTGLEEAAVRGRSRPHWPAVRTTMASPGSASWSFVIFGRTGN
jgi:hypothetical protein